MIATRPTPECERVASAIADGRFLEDPAFWRPHVERCPVCKPRVEGLFLLRERIDAAAGVAPLSPPGVVPQVAVGRAFVRLRTKRRRQRIVGCALAGLVIAASGFAWRSRPESPSAPRDPTAYAMRLWRTVFPGGGKADRERLHHDEALRREFLAALDDPSSAVRRVALAGLSASGIPVDPERLARTIAEWREDLGSPLEVASLDGSSRELTDALALSHEATVAAVANAAFLQASRKGRHVDPMALESILSDRVAESRRDALMALELDPGYRPGARVWTLLRNDTSVEVRCAAVSCLLHRLDEQGQREVLDYLRDARDYELENRWLGPLSSTKGMAEISRLRLASPETPVETALRHALLLVRQGEGAMPSALIDRALASGSAVTLQALAILCDAADWSAVRTRLQEAWRAAPPGEDRKWVGRILVGWDAKSEEPSRLRMALDIMETDDHPTYRPLLERLQKHEDAAIRARAEAIARSRPAK